MMPDSDRREFLKRTLFGGLLLGGCSAGVVARARTVPGTAGLPKLVMRHPSGAAVEVYLQGAHVTSWTRANGEEMLFLSANSRFAPGETIRGGIPVIFPQFANVGPLPGHGFLKTAVWQVTGTGTSPSGAVFAELSTADSRETRALWPHPFRASLRLVLDDTLTTAITIENTGASAFSFHCVLHTYHRLGDLRQVTIEGVEGALYQDRLVNGADRTESTAPLRVEGETNRIYVGRAGAIRVRDGSRGRVVRVERTGFEDVVVWNPGVFKARTSSGLAEGEYLTMVAVEVAQIARPVVLGAGERWTGVQRLVVE